MYSMACAVLQFSFASSPGSTSRWRRTSLVRAPAMTLPRKKSPLSSSVLGSNPEPGLSFTSLFFSLPKVSRLKGKPHHFYLLVCFFSYPNALSKQTSLPALRILCASLLRLWTCAWSATPPHQLAHDATPPHSSLWWPLPDSLSLVATPSLALSHNRPTLPSAVGHIPPCFYITSASTVPATQRLISCMIENAITLVME